MEGFTYRNGNTLRLDPSNKKIAKLANAPGANLDKGLVRDVVLHGGEKLQNRDARRMGDGGCKHRVVLRIYNATT